MEKIYRKIGIILGTLVVVFACYIFYNFVILPKAGGQERNTMDTLSEFKGKKPKVSEAEINNCTEKELSRIKQLPKLATFEDYQIKEQYTGKTAPLDLNSSFIARRFKTVISNFIKENKVNFAGHYIIARINFTGRGELGVIVDAINGKAYPFPYESNLYSGFDYQKDSRLLVVNSPNATDPAYLCDRNAQPWYIGEEFQSYYFVWEDNFLTFLGPKNGQPPKISDWMQP